MRKNLIAGALIMALSAMNAVYPAFGEAAEEVYTPSIIFEERFAGEDGQDLATAPANKTDGYFSTGFYLTQTAVLDSNRTNRFAIKKQTFDGEAVNTIKRLSGQPMTTAQSPYKTLKTPISLQPESKNVYYIKWREYIQNQTTVNEDGTKKLRYGGFAAMPQSVTANNYDACMLLLNNNRTGAGICNAGGSALKAFVSTGATDWPVFDSKELKEDTWYDMVLKLEANPGGKNNSISLKVYETGTEPEGGYGAEKTYTTSLQSYTTVGYHFRAQNCLERKSDMAISANKAECFSGAAAEAAVAAEQAVEKFEANPTMANKEEAAGLAAKLDSTSIAAQLLNSRISAVEIIPDAQLQSVAVSGKADMVGARMYADCTFGEGVIPQVSYKWYRDGAEIEGAAGDVYTTTAADVGKMLSVSATAGAVTKTSEAVNISDTATVIADETVIESDIGAAAYDRGFSTGWRFGGTASVLSASAEIGDNAAADGDMINFKTVSGEKYMRGLSAPIYTNSDQVYYITWVQDAPSMYGHDEQAILQKVELGTAEGASELVFGVNCPKSSSIQRFNGLYKRSSTVFPEVYIYPGEKYRVVVRIDASSEANKDNVYYKVFKENELVSEPNKWDKTESGITLSAECFDKILVQSSKAPTDQFNRLGGLKIERYPAETITNIDAAVSGGSENAQQIINSLPDGIAKNDFSAKLAAPASGVLLKADKTKLPASGAETLNVTVCNYDAIYYRSAKLIVAEYAEDGHLIDVALNDMAPMQEQILNADITVSEAAHHARIMLFDSIQNIVPLHSSILLER
ncbi:MAG: hypothetical protein J6N52_02925 [Clostridia bacterium]|nr:hypothetical protein [Clostridia bacterium]